MPVAIETILLALVLLGEAAFWSFAAWVTLVVVNHRWVERDPARWPELRAEAASPWWLRRGSFEDRADRLHRLGFEEKGVLAERVGLLALRSRQFYRASDGTWASLWSFLSWPQVSFTTALGNGVLVLTTTTGQPAGWRGRLLEAGHAGSDALRLELHLANVADARSYGPPPAKVPDGTMATRVAMARAAYVNKFGTR